MKSYLVLLGLFFYQVGNSQELFLMTDPASNLPAKSLSVNVLQTLLKNEYNSSTTYQVMPEVSYGVNRNLMLRATAFANNKSDQFDVSGGSLYAKYRFYSEDDLNSHFRLAAFGRYSYNERPTNQEQIEIMGNNTGFETGIVGTKLIKKLAISSTIGFEKAIDNNSNSTFSENFGDNATNYTLSFGQLVYPKKYTSLKQTNINLMLEFVGQTINENGKSYVDVVPVIQFIFNSQARLDLGYKQELMSSMIRSSINGIYFNLYYTFFDLKK